MLHSGTFTRKIWKWKCTLPVSCSKLSSIILYRKLHLIHETFSYRFTSAQSIVCSVFLCKFTFSKVISFGVYTENGTYTYSQQNFFSKLHLWNIFWFQICHLYGLSIKHLTGDHISWTIVIIICPSYNEWVFYMYDLIISLILRFAEIQWNRVHPTDYKVI